MTNHKTMPEISIDIAIDVDLWPDESELRACVSRACQNTQNWLARMDNQLFTDKSIELSLLFTDNASIQMINAQWRNIDKPTNVLSFPTINMTDGKIPDIIVEPMMLGDIIFAYETIKHEADELGKSLFEYLTHLFIHGFLHLLGYDHINDDDGDKMESIEAGILTSMGLSNPYNHHICPM